MISIGLESKIGKIGARIALAVAAPALFFFLLEGFLAWTGWVQPMRLLQQVEHEGKIYWTTNQQYGSFVFERATAPQPSLIWTPAEKPAGVTRVVVVGESAAQGFPMPEFNLARILDALWHQPDDARRIEFINLTMTGINSHILREFAREVLVLDPDYLVFYAGHNEYIGPFGAASVFGGFQPSPRIIQLLIRLRRSRVGRLIVMISSSLENESATHHLPWQGLDEFREAQIAFEDPVVQATARNWQRNVNAILDRAQRAKVPVLLVTPAVNLTDWPPLGSQSAVLDRESAWEAWRNDDLTDLSSANQMYGMAQEMHLHYSVTEAWPLYRFALDLDLYRFRADSGIRDGLEEIAKQREIPHVDSDWQLHEGNPVFESDRRYFLEHVHLTFEGRVQVANTILEALAPFLGKDGAMQTMDSETIATDLLYTARSEFEMWSRIVDLYQYPVFQNQAGANTRVELMSSYLSHLQQSVDSMSSFAQVQEQYWRAIERRPWDVELHFTFAQHALDARAPDEALNAIQAGLSHSPRHLEGLLNLAHVQLSMAKLDAADETLSVIASLDQMHRRYPNLAGQLAARLGNYEVALTHFQRAADFEPHSGLARANVGLCYLALQRHQQAITQFRKAKALGHSPPSLLNNFAWSLLTQPSPQSEDIEEARRLVLQALDMEPQSLTYLGTLALAEAAAGNAETAMRHIGVVREIEGVIEQLEPELARWGVELTL